MEPSAAIPPERWGVVIVQSVAAGGQAGREQGNLLFSCPQKREKEPP